MTEPIPGEPDGDATATGERLARERPVPGAGFRGALGRALAAEDPGYGPRPPHLRLTVAALLTVALLLLAVALMLSL